MCADGPDVLTKPHLLTEKIALLAFTIHSRTRVTRTRLQKTSRKEALQELCWLQQPLAWV